MLARAVVTPNEFVLVRLLNPNGNGAVMSEISEVKDDDLVSVSQQFNGHDLEEVFQELLKGISLLSHQQDLLLAFLLMFLQFQLGRTDVLQTCSTRLLLPHLPEVRRMSPQMRVEMHELLKDMIPFFNQSKSSWASPYNSFG